MIRGAGAVLPEQTIASFDSPVQVWDWSHDGRSLLIGRTHPDTRDDLWIQPPTEGAPAQPYETRDGELFFRRGSEIHHVELGPGHVFQHGGAPLEVTVMNRLFDAAAAVRSYDVSPDGRRFLINLPASSATRAPITLVYQWARE